MTVPLLRNDAMSLSFLVPGQGGDQSVEEGRRRESNRFGWPLGWSFPLYTKRLKVGVIVFRFIVSTETRLFVIES